MSYGTSWENLLKHHHFILPQRPLNIFGSDHMETSYKGLKNGTVFALSLATFCSMRCSRQAKIDGMQLVIPTFRSWLRLS